MSGRRPTLFVTGFPPDIRAKDLAVEFEKFGEIIRCDVPAPTAGRSSRYAFIEYVNEDDAEKAHLKLHGENFEGSKLIVEWAKRTPGSRWRPGGAPPPPREGDPREGRGYSDRGDRDRPRGDYRDRERDGDRDRPRGDYRDSRGGGGGGGDRDRDRRGDRDRERERERPVDVRRSRSPPRRSERPREERVERPREDRPREERGERGEYTRREGGRSPRGGGGGGGDRRRDERGERDVEMAPVVRRSATPPPKAVYENGRPERY